MPRSMYRRRKEERMKTKKRKPFFFFFFFLILYTVVYFLHFMTACECVDYPGRYLPTEVPFVRGEI